MIFIHSIISRKLSFQILFLFYDYKNKWIWICGNKFSFFSFFFFHISFYVLLLFLTTESKLWVCNFGQFFHIFYFVVVVEMMMITLWTLSCVFCVCEFIILNVGVCVCYYFYPSVNIIICERIFYYRFR